MKARSGLTLLAALIVLVGCFSEPQPEPPEALPEDKTVQPETDFSFPLTRSLVDTKGRKIEAHLIGRSDTHVKFYRLGTANREIFNFPIKNLSVNDQAFLSRFPTTYSQPLKNTDAPTTQESAKELRLRNLDIEIARQKERISEQQDRLTPTITTSQRKAIRNEITRKVAELKDMEERRAEIASGR